VKYIFLKKKKGDAHPDNMSLEEMEQIQVNFIISYQNSKRFLQVDTQLPIQESTASPLSFNDQFDLAKTVAHFDGTNLESASSAHFVKQRLAI